MLFLVQHGYRCVALDRRGHGRASQASTHNDMDGYADDLAAVIEALDLRDATLVGHSTGGGEVARYIGRHGSKRVKKAILIAAVPPIMLRTPSNPEGLPMEVFDQIRAGVAGDRSQFYKEVAIAFYGANRPGAKVSQRTLDQVWLWSMQASAKNAYESVNAFSQTDFTEDLKKFDVPDRSPTYGMRGGTPALFRSPCRPRASMSAPRSSGPRTPSPSAAVITIGSTSHAGTRCASVRRTGRATASNRRCGKFRHGKAQASSTAPRSRSNA